jgi:hypothetical protein
VAIIFSRAARAVTRRVEPDGEKADVRKQIVCTPRWVREVEEWCKRQPGRAPTFSEAIRILTERAIQDEARSPNPHPKDREGERD